MFSLCLLKSKLKYPLDSCNYRLITTEIAASKIFEKIMLTRVSELLHTSDNRFGFKPKHSTEMCVYAIKEVINYYTDLNSLLLFVYVSSTLKGSLIELATGNSFQS